MRIRLHTIHIHIHIHNILFIIHSSRELTAENKLLAVLRMFAAGNFEQMAADYIGISQQTLSAILEPVCNAILSHFDNIVRMPRTEGECLAKALGMAEIADFPRCIGAIDCSYIKMNSPGGLIVSIAFRFLVHSAVLSQLMLSLILSRVKISGIATIFSR